MYISDEMPATCAQVMPLFAVGTSSKAGRASGSVNREGDLIPVKGSSAPRQFAEPSAFVNPDRPSSCSQRRREIMTREPSAALEATCSVRRFRGGCGRFGGSFALELHFLRCAFFAAGAIVGDRQLIMTGRVFRHNLHVFLERRHGVREFLRGGKRHAQREVGFRESGVDLRGSRKMRGSVVPLSGAAGDFAE